MCDTAGKILPIGGLFAKNSDRRVNEPQVVEYYPPKINFSDTVSATYITIDQVHETYAHVLSRPVWLWGGEMGVNECSVAIGNEAVFTKGAYGKTGLTGMDMLRIGLERGSTAKEAMEAMISVLERYGQGGNCSYDGKMYYDNSFIIMDKREMYVLETHNKQWVYKSCDSYAISNALTIGTDGDAYSDGAPANFASACSDKLKTAFVFANKRRSVMETALLTASGPKDMMTALQSHNDPRINPMKHMTAFGPCMHAGPLNGDATTASMVAQLRDRPLIWTTGCSAPCISLYKPWAFGSKNVLPVCKPQDKAGSRYWLEREAFHRLAVGKKLPEEFYMQKNQLQDKWLSQAEQLDEAHMYELSEQAYREESDFYGRWRGAICTSRKGSKAFLKFWREGRCPECISQ